MLLNLIFKQATLRFSLLLGGWLFLGLSSLLAQKQLSRTYLSTGIENLLIDANGVHSLSIEAGVFDTISVNVSLEGETSEEIVVKEHIESGKLSLGFGAWPLAKSFNDKLSAHKVISVEVVIKVPQDLFVSILSTTSEVTIEGVFETVYVKIEDKYCLLQDFSGNANINTNHGDISAFVANSETYGVAESSFGSVQNTLPGQGKFLITAQSTHGDIILKETQ